MTRGVDSHRVVFKSLGLALLCTLVTVPYFHHLLSASLKTQGRVISTDLNTVLITQLFLLFIVCLLSAVIGFSFSKRLELPGFGDPGRLNETAPLLLVIGGVMGALTYLVFDRYFFHTSPVSYPKDMVYLVFYPFKAAFTNEVILRFCMVTLAAGVLKNKIGGVILVSAVASVFTSKYFQFLGLDLPFNYIFIAQALIAFLINFILGYFFITQGLIYSITLHFLFATRMPLIVLALG